MPPFTADLLWGRSGEEGKAALRRPWGEGRPLPFTAEAEGENGASSGFPLLKSERRFFCPGGDSTDDRIEKRALMCG